MANEYYVGATVRRLGGYNEFETVVMVNKVYFTTTKGRKYSVKTGKRWGAPGYDEYAVLVPPEENGTKK